MLFNKTPINRAYQFSNQHYCRPNITRVPKRVWPIIMTVTLPYATSTLYRLLAVQSGPKSKPQSSKKSS